MTSSAPLCTDEQYDALHRSVDGYAEFVRVNRQALSNLVTDHQSMSVDKHPNLRGLDKCLDGVSSTIKVKRQDVVDLLMEHSKLWRTPPCSRPQPTSAASPSLPSSD